MVRISPKSVPGTHETTERLVMAARWRMARWAAWAPGLTDSESWLRWLAAPWPLPADGKPALAAMPAMMRRRLDPLGRIALETAYACQADDAACPVVFASRYGEVGRSLALLESLVGEGQVSPMSFSLSVHNAIGALYSIARHDVRSYSAIAAGDETVEAAFVEAAGLLADGAPAVMVVVYDEPLPVRYQAFADRVTFPRGWACRLEATDTGGLSLRTGVAGPARVADDVLPPDLAVLAFLLSDRPACTRQVGARQWQWCRHD